MTIYAPIIIFAFNRLESLKVTVDSVLHNSEAAESDLFVFVDGARPHKEGEKEKVYAIQEYVKTISGFKSTHYYFSDRNKGLANSIISGTTKVINEYGKVIVLEDDLYVSNSFLHFMNEMLDKCQNDPRIMQVSGFGCKLTKVKSYPFDAYINERAHSWSWGTWKDRWETVDWDVMDYKELLASPKLQKAFNKRGSDLFGMLKGYMEHKNSSWYIRFNYSMYKQRRYSVMPVRSLVRNDGFGEYGTHCNSFNRFKIDFEKQHIGEFNYPEIFEPCERIIKNSVRYWQIPYRIYGKLRTILSRNHFNFIKLDVSNFHK